MEEKKDNPKNLTECFIYLDEMLLDSPDKDWFKEAKEKEAIAQSHHGLGQWIRNNWSLWVKESDLHQYFIEMELHHPDDMSGVILTSYHRHINNKELKLDEQIKHYIEFWKKNS